MNYMIFGNLEEFGKATSFLAFNLLDAIWKYYSTPTKAIIWATMSQV